VGSQLDERLGVIAAEDPLLEKREKWGTPVFFPANVKDDPRYASPPEMCATRREAAHPQRDLGEDQRETRVIIFDVGCGPPARHGYIIRPGRSRFFSAIPQFSELCLQHGTHVHVLFLRYCGLKGRNGRCSSQAG